MYALNHDLARAMMDDRRAEMDRIPRRRRIRLTRPRRSARSPPDGRSPG